MRLNFSNHQVFNVHSTESFAHPDTPRLVFLVSRKKNQSPRVQQLYLRDIRPSVDRGRVRDIQWFSVI